ncbi:MmgE/PrpD family protein [Litorivita sp. NS0012-18]|uniref:MmgE/PrpD family protein n=1 Tax=Litorivita sp. NS0012-18 TaxID=3127655 RepID=UPI0031067826
MSGVMTTLLDLADLPEVDIPSGPLEAARNSLFDWMVCGHAGSSEPVAQKMRAFMQAEGGAGVASVFGGGLAPARMAALVNGTISHAIDFDDTHFAHVGHLSVGIYPAALAAGEAEGATKSQIIAAFLLGAEAAIRVGLVLGNGHYNRGFHQTATAGAFGATLAAGRLMGLSRAQMRAALGLCATRASGLKSQFGTMGKPLNAGIAASNGVEAAQLARLGMTSCEDGLMGAQGFVATHSDAPQPDVAPVGEWIFPAISYKFHACCHGTHAMIEGLRALLPLAPETIETITLRTNPRWLSVCNIAKPATGLEVKFSYAWLAAMVFMGRDTGAFGSYTDAAAGEAALGDIARRVAVSGDAELSDMQAEGAVVLTDGTRLGFAYDLAKGSDACALSERLIAKSRALLGDAASRLDPVLSASDVPAAELGQHIRTGI